MEQGSRIILVRSSSENHSLIMEYNKNQLQSLLQMMGCKPWYLDQLTGQTNILFLESIFNGQLENQQDPISLDDFLVLVERVLLAEHPRHASYSAPNHYLRDLSVAHSIQSKNSSITIILGGTSGCGKSTLSGLLASRFGISTVLATDTLRHILRTRLSRDIFPVLWKSSYNAEESLQSNISLPSSRAGRIICGFNAQNDLLLGPLDLLIGEYESRHESVIIEGVHLSIQNIISLLEKHPSILPFIIYINNSSKHADRLALRAKNLDRSPTSNQYIRYFDNIRTIQEFILRDAELHKIPTIDNTNVDLSLAIVHRTIFNALSKFDMNKNQSRGAILKYIYSSYIKVSGKRMPSKDVFELIRRSKSRSKRRQIRFFGTESPHVISDTASLLGS